METSLNSRWTAKQVMNSYPSATVVFVELKADCVGCPLSRFCTLDEVADSYNISVTMLMDKLNGIIHRPNS